MLLRTFIRKYSVSPKKISIINAEFQWGQPRNGVQFGPDFIKQNILGRNLVQNLKNLNFDPEDSATISDTVLDEHGKGVMLPNSGKANEKLAHEVRKAIDNNKIPLVLGGDHSLGIGTVYGTQTSKLGPFGLIWIDAHADINTPKSSSTKNLHGQSVSYVAKELSEYVNRIRPKPRDQKKPGFDWLKPCLPLRNLVYIGLRDIDTAETYIMDRFKVKVFSMNDVQNKGIEKVVQEAIAYLSIGQNKELLPLHVSIDIDSLDSLIVPSTGTPVLSGLSLRELMKIGNLIHKTGKLRALDLVEVNPFLANDAARHHTLVSAQRTILSFFGFDTTGTVDSDYQLERPVKKNN